MFKKFLILISDILGAIGLMWFIAALVIGVGWGGIAGTLITCLLSLPIVLLFPLHKIADRFKSEEDKRRLSARQAATQRAREAAGITREMVDAACTFERMRPSTFQTDNSRYDSELEVMFYPPDPRHPSGPHPGFIGSLLPMTEDERSMIVNRLRHIKRKIDG